MGSFFEKMYGKYYEPLPDADAYLRRIGLKREDISLDKQGLDKIQRAQLYSVPFENIDLYDYDRPVDFGTVELFDKIVTRRRGGYCYELNALFMTLLESVGFEVFPVGARLLFGADTEPWERVPAISHRVSIVTIGGKRYVSDVGVGVTSAPLVSICIDEYGEQDVAGEIYTVEDRPYNNKLVIRQSKDGPSTVMTFVPNPVPIIDFVHLNYAMARSAFRTKRMANLRGEEVTMSIDGGIFRVRRGGELTETPITTADEARAILTEKYGMVLDATPLREKGEIEPVAL